MHCKKCGAALGTDKSVCPVCGAVLASDQMEVLGQEKRDEDAKRVKLLSEMYGQKTFYEKPKEDKSLIFILGGFGIVILILIIILIIVSR